MPVNAEHCRNELEVFRGAGAISVKSREFFAVSMHPLSPLAMAIELLGAGAGPVPSKQFAVVP